MVMQLLAAPTWILDVVFFAILLLGLLFGSWRGFVAGVCKLAGTVFAIFVALTFCNPFKNSLESAFGLTSLIAGKLGETLGSWLSLAIAFVALFVIVKLVVWLLGKVGTSLIEKSAVFSKINRFLGAILGLAEAAFLVFFLLTVCYWINVDSVNAFIQQSTIVGKIYEWDWFQWAAQLNFLK